MEAEFSDEVIADRCPFGSVDVEFNAVLMRSELALHELVTALERRGVLRSAHLTADARRDVRDRAEHAQEDRRVLHASRTTTQKEELFGVFCASSRKKEKETRRLLNLCRKRKQSPFFQSKAKRVVCAERLRTIWSLSKEKMVSKHPRF